MRVGVVGINHKLADLKLREQLAKACQKWFSALQAVHEQHHFVLLSTCNRTEIYFSSHDLTDTHIYLLGILRVEVQEEFDHKLYSYFGIDCFLHLSRVTLGLDSAIIAETEIQGQVKLAYENVCDCHVLPGDLHYLFQKALGIGKKLRSELQFGRGMPNLEHGVLHIGKEVFKTSENIRLLFVGISEINEKILLFLNNRSFNNITVCNRTDHHASLFSKEHGIHHICWAELKSWQDYDWIIFGTKSPEYLITKKEINTGPIKGPRLIMDLCVPRNVDPRIGHDARFTLLNIDQINRQVKVRHQRMDHLLSEAERRVFAAAHDHVKRFTEKTALVSA